MIEIHPSFMSHTFRTVQCQAAADDPKSFLITLLRASSCREFPLATGYEQVSKPKGTLVNTKISGLSGCPFLWWNWFNDPLQSFCLLLCKWEDGEFPPPPHVHPRNWSAFIGKTILMRVTENHKRPRFDPQKLGVQRMFSLTPQKSQIPCTKFHVLLVSSPMAKGSLKTGK